jgi:hypothetical protein
LVGVSPVFRKTLERIVGMLRAHSRDGSWGAQLLWAQPTRARAATPKKAPKKAWGGLAAHARPSCGGREGTPRARAVRRSATSDSRWPGRRLARWTRAVLPGYAAKYFVARVWPCLRGFFLARPVDSTRGTSRRSSRRDFWICSELRPSFLPFTSETTGASVFAMSSGERRARRPARARLGVADAPAAWAIRGRP